MVAPMARRDWLQIILMLPFVATTPLLVPQHAPDLGRAIVVAAYFIVGTLVSSFVARRLTR